MITNRPEPRPPRWLRRAVNRAASRLARQAEKHHRAALLAEGLDLLIAGRQPADVVRELGEAAP